MAAELNIMAIIIFTKSYGDPRITEFSMVTVLVMKIESLKIEILSQFSMINDIPIV